MLIDYLVTLQWSHWRNALAHLVLPATALALGFSPLVIRVLRSSLLETSEDHYVTVARQRGLTERQIILSHMLRNSALPTITLIGAQFGFLFGGTLLVETIFSYPGIGNLMVQAMSNHDLPLIQGIALVFCVITLLINPLWTCCMSSQPQAPPRLRPRTAPSPMAAALRGAKRSPKAAIGAVIVPIMVICALFAPLIAPQRPGEPGPRPHAAAADVVAGRHGAYPFGTDSLGRGILSRLIYGARVALIVGFWPRSARCCSARRSALVAGYFGGWIDC